MGPAVAGGPRSGPGGLMQPIIGEPRTPYFLVDETRLTHNLEILRDVQERAGCKILLAQKAFSMFSVYPLLRQYLAGSTASGLYEARLGHEEFGGETHVFSPAYREDEWDELLQYADDIVFNSPAQVRRFAPRAPRCRKSCGLRLNPEHSTQEGHAIYDPCSPGSRLGTTLAQFDESILPLLDGLHFHTLCEQNSDALEETVAAVEKKIRPLAFSGEVAESRRRPSYHPRRLRCGAADPCGAPFEGNLRLCRCIWSRGEAVVLNAGFLVTSVLETLQNGMDIAILDTSAACHMPDVLEMPYRPPLRDAGQPGEKAHTSVLVGPTCLAGDVIGDYSFDVPLREGDRLVFEDMALYTMVKNQYVQRHGAPLHCLEGQERQSLSGAPVWL